MHHCDPRICPWLPASTTPFRADCMTSLPDEACRRFVTLCQLIGEGALTAGMQRPSRSGMTSRRGARCRASDERGCRRCSKRSRNPAGLEILVVVDNAAILNAALSSSPRPDALRAPGEISSCGGLKRAVRKPCAPEVSAEPLLDSRDEGSHRRTRSTVCSPRWSRIADAA